MSKKLHNKLTELVDILVDTEDKDLNYEEFGRIFRMGDSKHKVIWTIKVTKRRMAVK